MSIIAHMRELFLTAALAAAVLCVASVSLAQSITSGQISVSHQGDKGVRILFAGVPVIRATSMQLYAPGWKESYYSSNNNPVQARAGNGQLVIEHRAKKIKFEPTETIRATGENRIEITLAGKLEADVEARLEWAIGYVNAFALYGGSVSALNSDALRPILPERAEKRDGHDLVRDAAGVRITTRVGQIIVKVEKGPAELTILDGRRAPASWWQEEAPTLWLGMLGVPIKPNDAFEFVVSIEFKPNPPRAQSEPITAAAATKVVEDALVPHTGPIHIIPKPKSLTWKKDEFFRIPSELKIAADASARRAGESLREQLDRFEIKSSLVSKDATITMALKSAADRPAESYELHVSKMGVTLAAPDAAGLFYGVQTLAQMLQVDATGRFIPAADILDEPSLKFRGVHMFTGRDSVPFFRKLATNVLARFKFNHLVLESEYTEWETDRKIWIDQSVPKAQVAEYVKIARENWLEPIPLVQSLGHGEWMFRHKQNLDIAEDPSEPYAYAVTVPRTYDFIRAIYAEALQLFDQPKYFHIGHDEVDMLGRYPQRDEAKQWGESKLFTYDVNKHEEFLKPQNTKLMLWGDMLLAKGDAKDACNAPSAEEARKRRDALPRDAIICDWHYDAVAPDKYTSLKIFKDEGFKTLACPWYDPNNIASFAQAARNNGIWGLLQTTWAGYHVTEETLDREMRQFAAYILAAEYAWSGDSPAPADLPWRAEEVLAAALNLQHFAGKPQPGAQLDLSKAANMKLDAWLGFPSAALSNLNLDDRIAGLSFAPSASSAIVLDGALLPRELKAARTVTLTAEIPHATELAFLHATAAPAAPGQLVGAYDVTFADGSTAKIPLRYGLEIRAWSDIAPASAATAGWFGKTKNNLDVGVRMLRWRNSHPDRAIHSITFTTDHAYASPTLFGVTALSAP